MNFFPSAPLLLFLGVVWVSSPLVHTFTLPSEGTLCRGSRTSKTTRCRLTRYSNDNNDKEAVQEVVQSMVKFHEGTWESCGPVKSFTVTDDVAAGIVQRYTALSPYQVSVKLGLEDDVALSETWTWQQPDAEVTGTSTKEVSSRHVSLQSCNVDVDVEDASYSLDQTVLHDDDNHHLPWEIFTATGTTTLPPEEYFLIEHCIAVSNDCRARCWALYDIEQHRLVRIVVTQEQRVKSNLESSTNGSATTTKQAWTAADLLELQSDVDRLVEKITGDVASSGGNSKYPAATPDEERLQDLTQRMNPDAGNQDNNGLTLHRVSLLELSAGVWLGDVIIRDHPNVPIQLQTERGQGFGTTATSAPSTPPPSTGLAEWSIGVQKIAWRWMWNFGDEIRQVNDVGKAMGAELVPNLATSLAGTVCVNEGLSRRIPKEDRMVYIDWSGTDDVGFLLESFAIQLPRYLTFDRAQKSPRGNGRRPLCTEFSVFQSTTGGSAPPPSAPNAPQDDEDDDVSLLPQLICSKISRVYNYEGLLKQGCSSVFNFKRFGTEKDDI